MKKRNLVILLAIPLAIVFFQFAYAREIEATKENIGFYRELADEYAAIQLCDSSSLSLDMLQERNGTIIIERSIGIVETNDRDGRIINPYDPEYDYISYRSVPDCKKGDVILTYFICNPETNEADDILERFDYIIEKAK